MVWVKQNVNFFQQNGSVIKIEQNWACSAKSPKVSRMNKNNFCSFSKKKKNKLLSMLSIAYFSLLTIFCKIGYMFCPSQVHIFFLGKIANVFIEWCQHWHQWKQPQEDRCRFNRGGLKLNHRPVSCRMEVGWWYFSWVFAYSCLPLPLPYLPE
jgi:hypothetical protein